MYAIFLEKHNISFYTRCIHASVFCQPFVMTGFPSIDKPDNHKRHFLKLKYIRRGIDFINLSKTFNDSTIYSQIPSFYDEIEPHKISFSYTKISRSLIFTYTLITSDVNIENNTVEYHEVDTFLRKNQNIVIHVLQIGNSVVCS